uniref:Neural cell adhesion molecule L1.1-like n=1 Tax=Scophthalmus maximus TaxID=52904 RepID=A0A8D3B0Y5_SCOMX
MTEMPTSYTAFSREDIYLPCEATGIPAPTFRWVKDGEVFGSEYKESGTLRAEGDELLDSYEGLYRCYASNTLGTAMTQTVQVIVEPQPVLLKQQKIHKRAFEGESVVLSCNPPESSTPPHIHWMDKKMVHIKQNDRVMVGLDGSLYFANLLKSDSRDDYVCNAQYSAARTILPETSVRLTVMPTLISSISLPTDPFLFRCPSLCGHSLCCSFRFSPHHLLCVCRPTPKVEWKKKDGRLDETGGVLESAARWLSFDSIAQTDDGEYECRAFNIHGSTAHSSTLTVEAAPYWVKEPQSLLYSPGETVRLDCQAEAIPTPVITWSINGQPVTDVDDDPRRSVSGGVLKLRDVEFADTAVYQCEASNRHGSILLNTYLYVIELPPQILSSDRVVYRVTEGGDIMLHCEAFGSPRPHVAWEGEDMVPLLSDPRVSLLTNGTLELSGVSHDDSGTYTCSVQHTNISITAHLEVFNRTEILTSPQDVRVLSGSSALLDCRFYKDPRLLDYQIVWRKDGQKLQESSPDDKYTFFENGSLKVSGVQSDDTAPYTCEVITDMDNVQASGSITVVARPDPPRDLSLSDVEDHSLTLSWIPGHSHNSPVVEFIVEVREEQHTEEGKWQLWRRVPGDFNHLQLTLHPYCTYRFRVIAVNEIGHSNPSKPSDHHSTPPAVPDSNPTGVRSDSTDPKTLIITWDEMDKHLHNGQDFQYKVSWRESPPFHVNDTGTYTPFEIKVRAVNSLGVGPDPEPEIGHSGEEKPDDAPTGVETTVMNSTVRVKWNEAQSIRGRLLGYKVPVTASHRLKTQIIIQYSEFETFDDVTLDFNKLTSEEVTGLRLFSRYEVSVTAFNSKGEGPHSQPHRFSTPEGAPGPPESLTFESPTEKSMILFWTPPVETNGILLGYMVQYQQEVESRDSPLQMEIISDPSMTRIVLEHLDPSSHYIFKVIARTATGDGPPITRRFATLLDGVPPSNISIVTGNTSLNLTWVPGERDRNHGFHIRYRRKSAGVEWEESEEVNSTQGLYSLTGLQPGTQYQLEVMHGNFTQWKDVTWTNGPVPSEMPGGFATQGWLIGLISAIVLILLILFILCLIKRSRGGKYAGNNTHCAQLNTHTKSHTLFSTEMRSAPDSQPSLCGESKLGSDDSLAEYGDSVDIQFNEDGSFIGQYSGRGPVPHGNESSGPASPVTAVPPPPIAPSMSSILNRPS